mmetsp:Transcript_40604/g.131456  ORF Transcript_40604/g.131456 Transcript_40604/m.131456 type:complete len:220 (+) Transcript_40604:765-1424(+)
MTAVTSSTVMDVSAMFVASTTLRTPAGGRSNTRRWSSGGSVEWSGSSHARCGSAEKRSVASSASCTAWISLKPGKKTSTASAASPSPRRDCCGAPPSPPPPPSPPSPGLSNMPTPPLPLSPGPSPPPSVARAATAKATTRATMHEPSSCTDRSSHRCTAPRLKRARSARCSAERYRRSCSDVSRAARMSGAPCSASVKSWKRGELRTATSRSSSRPAGR